MIFFVNGSLNNWNSHRNFWQNSSVAMWKPQKFPNLGNCVRRSRFGQLRWNLSWKEYSNNCVYDDPCQLSPRMVTKQKVLKWQAPNSLVMVHSRCMGPGTGTGPETKGLYIMPFNCTHYTGTGNGTDGHWVAYSITPVPVPFLFPLLVVSYFLRPKLWK